MRKATSIPSGAIRTGAWIAGVLVLSSLLLAAQPSVGVQARSKIKHVVIIVQENRTFDNIFGGDPGNPAKPIKPVEDPCRSDRPIPFPGADATFPPTIAEKMKCQRFGGPGAINASHDVWQCLKDYKYPFSPEAWENMLQERPKCNDVRFNKPFRTDPFNYLANDLRETDWDIARKYVLGDHFFAVTSTSSFPGHQYIVAAQSVEPTTKSIVADQPLLLGGGQGNGCIDGDDARLEVPVLQGNNYIGYDPFGIKGECYPNRTLADRMDEKKVSWTHFVSASYNDGQFESSGVFNGFINIEKWYRKTTSWPMSVTDLKQRIEKGDLPSVSWVKPPCIALSDHPAGASTDDSANWVGSVINWIGESKAHLWDDVAIFVLWDDWGGFYDHVIPPPTRTDRLGPGLRTPFLVVSPYGVNGSVVHTEADYGSVLKFVEDLFDLGRLTNVDKNAPDLAGFFDFSRKRPFTRVWVKKSFQPKMCQTQTVDRRLIDP